MHGDRTPVSRGSPRTRGQLKSYFSKSFSKSRKEKGSGSGSLENGGGSEGVGKGKSSLKQGVAVEVENSEGRLRRARGGGEENSSGLRGVGEGNDVDVGGSGRKKSGSRENNPKRGGLGKGRGLRPGKSDHGNGNRNLGVCGSSDSDSSLKSVYSDVVVLGSTSEEEDGDDLSDKSGEDVDLDAYVGMNVGEKVVESDGDDEVEFLGEELNLSSLKGKRDFGRGSKSKSGNRNENLPWDEKLGYILPNTSDSDNAAGESDESSDESTDLEALLGDDTTCDDDSDDEDYRREEVSKSDDSGSTQYASDDDVKRDSIRHKNEVDMIGVQPCGSGKDHGVEQLKDAGSDKRSNYRVEEVQAVAERDMERSRAVMNKVNGLAQHSRLAQAQAQHSGIAQHDRLAQHSGLAQHSDDVMEEETRVVENPFLDHRSNGNPEKEQSGLKIDDGANVSSHIKSPAGSYMEKGSDVMRTFDDVIGAARMFLGDDSHISGSKRLRVDDEKEIDWMDEAKKILGDTTFSETGSKKKKLKGLSIDVVFGDVEQRRLARQANAHTLRNVKDAQPGKVSPLPFEDSGTSSSSEDEAGECKKKRSPAARNEDLLRILVKSIDSMDDPVEESAPVEEPPLPLKFRFEDDVDPPPEKSEKEKEYESLFRDLQLALGASEIEDYANLSKTENEDTMPGDTDNSTAARCRRGDHQDVLDEQVGMVCQHCGVTTLDVRDILPEWHSRRYKKQNRKDIEESPDPIIDDSKFQGSTDGPPGSFTRAKGTVWDLVPEGVERDMFPHQREAFEFMWRNITGDIKLDKLKSPLCDSMEGTGCIISHAPGTGKTRLTIVFLQSFLKLYPKCHPVIIAPKGVLRTWETELTKWKADLVFHNLNEPHLSHSEIHLVTQKAGIKGIGTLNKDGARLVKLFSWIFSGGILGISYPLFGSLAGVSRKKGKTETEEAIWNLLVEKPDLLVLDEGHTPRNGVSRMWNALRKVKTRRRIILSGTPFQNNFSELKNTLCLADPKFLDLDKNDWREATDGADELKSLRKMLKSFVHVHKGSVLEQSLPGKRVTKVYLRPRELQSTLLEVANGISNYLKRTNIVSLISIHPSMVLPENNELFSSYKAKLEEIESDSDAGIKLKFVMNLTYLASEYGERVLIFSPYISPLNFIKKHLEARYSWKEGREILYMDGQIKEQQRQESIASLNDSSSQAKVLLASERACSEGINLIGASRVVLLDTVWNPFVEQQAISRSYRYLQNKFVYVYRLIISGLELEARQTQMQARKERISNMIFTNDDKQANQEQPAAPSEISEDKVLQAIVNLESCKDMFANIVIQSSDEGVQSPVEDS